jgi:hypothetical protein
MSAAYTAMPTKNNYYALKSQKSEKFTWGCRKRKLDANLKNAVMYFFFTSKKIYLNKQNGSSLGVKIFEKTLYQIQYLELA